MRNLKRNVTCLVLLFFLSSFTFYDVYGVASDQIVINEFDLNPPGNDNYGSVEEWVELFNPTSEDVDISGWVLSTTSGDTVSVAIPSETMIPANGYYVYRRGSQWLDNDEESIILHDASGKQIDQTPPKSDDDNDEGAWSRYPDGQDTDSATDWRFQESTEERSNGGEPSSSETESELESEPEPTASPEPTPTPTPEPTAPPIITPPTTPLTGIVTVHFIDVGQGDAIFVDTPGLDMLVDGGSRGEGDTVVGYLRSLNITRIDIIIATHPHADHIGGLITVLTEYNETYAPKVVDSGLEAKTDTYDDYVSAVGNRTREDAIRGEIIFLGAGVEVTILNPYPDEFDDANDNSVVLWLQVYEVTFLLTGDSEESAESSILAAGYSVNSTVLKVGHHGSQTSTSPEYLDAVDPEIAVISVGEGNRYDHPHQETLDKLTLESVAVYRTDLHGTVRVTTDGGDYTVLIEKGSPPPAPTPEPTASPGPTATASPGPSPTPSPKPDLPFQIPGFTPFQILLGTLVALIVITLMSKRNA
ncbi:MAG: lamin tail domain-containing protein [Candidatus Bathyarchaeota archaeon]|nr:lamin tail domain-containing protein [Candidatus Bathyarchaeota archaeon]